MCCLIRLLVFGWLVSCGLLFGLACCLVCCLASCCGWFAYYAAFVCLLSGRDFV